VLLPLALTASHGRGIGLAGSTVRDLPVESLTCEACARRTATSDLPPIGIDVVAVLEQLAAVGGSALPSPGVRSLRPTCTCGSKTLTWSTVVALTVHTAGATMLGEVSSPHPGATPTGTLTCGECSGSWDVADPDQPAQIREATTAFCAALHRGDVRPGE
jgi:hypothetical protein